MQYIKTYFPNLTPKQENQFMALEQLYTDWNAKINVISRKDIENLYLHHILHSLGIAKTINFADGSEILDVGTGGGFPGIPLAILFPECKFHLIDRIGKKIKVAANVAESIDLENVTFQHGGVEENKSGKPGGYAPTRSIETDTEKHKKRTTKRTSQRASLSKRR